MYINTSNFGFPNPLGGHKMSQFDPPPMYVQNPPQTGNPNAAYQMTSSNKDDLLRVVAVALRGFCLLFSFLSFVIIATVKGFNKTDTYSYVFAAALLSFLYNALQTAKGVFQIATRREFITNEKASAFVDFIGDQAITYMLLSGSSAGLAATNEGKQLLEAWGILDTKEYGKAAAATSMLFFAFIALAVPTLFSYQNLFRALSS